MRRSTIFTLLLLSSCLANQGLGTGSAAQVNIYRMSEVCLGMSEEQVFQIMRYPSRDEQIETNEGCYDVWFYITRVTALDQSELRPHNLTPLIFKDGVLVGRGYDYYNHILKKKTEVKAQTPVAMSSKPAQPKKKDKRPENENPEEKTSDEEKKYRWDKEDDRMIEQEQEQNFDYW